MANVLRILGNFASAFFLASGTWGDLLLIRIFLTCAYAFLVAITFIRSDPNPEGYVWNFSCLYLHGSSAVRLLLDEGSVKLDDDQELLWRYFYRHSGISRLLFKKYIAKRFELKTFEKGTTLDTKNYFYIILDGEVKIESTIEGSSLEFLLTSGAPFDIKHLKSFQHAFLKQNLSAVTALNSKIFCCSEENMKIICSLQEVKDASMGLLTASLSDIASRLFLKDSHKCDEEGQMMEKASPARSLMFDPLEDHEQPETYLAGASGRCCDTFHHILHTLKISFRLPWPLMVWVPGLRQVGSLPVPKSKMADNTPEVNVG